MTDTIHIWRIDKPSGSFLGKLIQVNAHLRFKNVTDKGYFDVLNNSQPNEGNNTVERRNNQLNIHRI